MRLRRRQADDQGGEVNGVEVAAIVVSLTCLALVTWMYMKDADREVSVFVHYPNGEAWAGRLRNTNAPNHGRYPASGGQLWCPACEAPVEECREADEIRRRLAALEGRVDE